MIQQNVIQINGWRTINIGVSVKNIIYAKKIIFGVLLNCRCENGKYLAIIVDDSALSVIKL